MGVDISIDTKPVSELLGRMITMIDHFKRVDLGMGLSEFQVEDMHRDKPFTMRSRARGIAVTKIRPHSLYEMERSLRAAKAYRRRRVRAFARMTEYKRVRAFKEYEHYSTRPILRDEMYAILEARMVRLLEEKISWSLLKRTG